MKVIKKFETTDISIDTFIKDYKEGKWTDWKRPFLLRNLTDGKIAIVSLNLFERIVWFFQELFGFQNYDKFESVFGTKNVKILTQLALNIPGINPVDNDDLKDPLRNITFNRRIIELNAAIQYSFKIKRK